MIIDRQDTSWYGLQRSRSASRRGAWELSSRVFLVVKNVTGCSEKEEKMKKLLLLLMCVVFAWAFASTAALAAEPGGRVGLGVSLIPDYEGSEEYDAWPVVFGRYTWANGMYADLGGSSDGRAGRARGNVIAEQWVEMLKAGPVLQFRRERDDVDSDRVDRMEKVDYAFEAGAFVGLAKKRWLVNLTAVTDVSDEHEGTLVELAAAYKFPVSDQADITFGVGATYADEDYMQTYFGVSPADSVRSGLPVYNADSGVKDVGANLALQYKFTSAWGALGAVKYNRLLGDAEDSPVVDNEGSENQFFLSLAAVYFF
jgi:outer membrane protein